MTATWWMRPGGENLGVTSSLLDRDELTVDPPRGSEGVRDLADRRVGLHGLDQRWQQVVRAPCGVVQAAHRCLPGARITLGADAPEVGDLPALPFRVDLLGRG